MSRSYREPWYVQGYGSKYKRFYKNYANRRIRYSKNIPDHKAYKKFYDSWDICDWKYLYDPRPHIYFDLSGKLTVLEPDPEWKVRRK